MIDFSQINNAALAHCPGVLEQILPGGRVNGAEYLCADVNGGEGRSFSVNLQSGLWKDFSGDSKGGRDIVSLVAEQRNLKQGEAARELAKLVGICTETGPTSSRTAGRMKSPALAPVMPIPASAPAWPRECGNLGIMTTSFEYRDAQGRLLGIVGRWNRPDGKQVRPLVYTSQGWKFQDFAKPYPLFGLDRLASAPPDRPVLLVEGEQKALDAQKLLGDSHVVLSVYGGASRVRYNDFSHLKGRVVIYWPDNDPAGLKAARDAVAGLRKAGVESVFVVTLPDGLPQKWDLSDAVREGWTADKVRGLIETSMVEDARGGEDKAGTITLDPADLNQNVRAVEDLLLKLHEHGKCRLYQRGGQIVRVTTSAPFADKRFQRPAGIPAIMPVSVDYLTVYLSRHMDFLRFDKRRDDFAPCKPPEDVARKFLALGGEWRLPVLTGVIGTPTLRPDGSILDKPGYDMVTGLFFDPAGVEFPPIPERPTFDEAKAALAQLLDLIRDFPFADEPSRAVAASAMLTGLVRHTIRTAPLFAFSAPTMGSGKSLLADVVALLATGKSAPALTYTSDADEMRKTLLSILMEGTSIVCLDNIETELCGDALCSALTQETLSGRVLGLSQTTTVSTQCTWCATGNNIVVKGDLRTRVIQCRIDPAVERPEERTFDRDLRKFIPDNRPRLVCAALTVLRAFCAAGRPQPAEVKARPFGRFEEWSGLIRAALVWCGMEDPILTREAVSSADPERATLSAVLTAWHACYGEKPQLMRIVLDDEQGMNQAKTELLTAISAAAPTKNVGSKAVGKLLTKYVDRIESGFCLRNSGSYQGQRIWKVERV